MKKTTLYNTHLNLNAKMTPFGGYEMPVQYSGVTKEHLAVRKGVGVFDVSHMGEFMVSGRKAIDLLQYICSNDISKISIGKAQYNYFPNETGGIVDDLIVYRLEDEKYLLVVNASNIEKDWKWVQKHNVDFGAVLEDQSEETALLAIQGPKANDVVAGLFGDWVRELKYFQFRFTELAGIPLVVARSGWSKQGGFELYLCDGQRGEELWDLVAKVGAPYGIGPGTPNYVERLESGLISYGADTDADTNPFELGMDNFINLDQPHEFIGKSALKAIKAAGVKRRFIGLLIDGAPFKEGNEHRWDVTLNGAYAGFASACAYSPRVGSNIGVGLISTAAIDAQDGVAVVTDDCVLPSRAAPFPLI